MAVSNAKGIDPARVAEALHLMEEHHARMGALIFTLERDLGEDCDEGRDADGPVNQFRIAEILKDLAEKDVVQEAREMIGIEAA